MRKASSGNVPVFWKLITQANFHGRGPPPKSFTRQLATRRRATAQAGALEGKGVEASPVSAAQLGVLIDLIGEGAISGKIAKDLFEILWNEGGDPRELVESRGLKQVTDLGAIEAAIDAIIAANRDKVEQAKTKPTLIGWFVGQVMKSTGGKANPQSVNELLRRKLGI